MGGVSAANPIGEGDWTGYQASGNEVKGTIKKTRARQVVSLTYGTAAPLKAGRHDAEARRRGEKVSGK
jgi:hypothetical protein